MEDEARKLRITDKMQPFLDTEKRIKVAFGGRAGTKSQTCVDALIYKVETQQVKVCCFREYGSSVEDSVWSLIGSEIERMKVDGFEILARKIDHVDGGVFKSKGLGRESRSVKSYSGFDIFLIEEGEFLTDDILEDLIPTLREEGSELWIIFNPQSRNDTASKNYILPFYNELLKHGVYEDDMHYIVWTNYDENPWLPEVTKNDIELDKKKVAQGLMSQAKFNHKWLGHFNDDVERAIIKQEWFDAAIDAHIKLKFGARGIEVVSHDPADEGEDPAAIVHRHGSVIRECVVKNDGDYNDCCDWALEYAIKNKVDLFVWDAIGNSLHKQVREALDGKRIDYQMFKGSNSVDDPLSIYEGEVADVKNKKTNKETFKNKRAQKAGYLADRFFNTYLAVKKGVFTDPDKLISISSDIKEMEELRAEVCRVPQKPNQNQLFQLYSKEELKTKFKINSPNRFDALYMSFEKNETIDNNVHEMEFDGWG